MVIFGKRKSYIVFENRYGHVLQKEGNDCMKKCVEYEVEGARPMKTWSGCAKRQAGCGLKPNQSKSVHFYYGVH